VKSAAGGVRLRRVIDKSQSRTHGQQDPRTRAREAERRALGSSIRALRAAEGRTLADVAGAAGVSISLLSQVERGLIDPSLDSLRDIAEALATTPFALLRNGSARSRVVRRAERLRLTLPDREYEYELLSPALHGAFEVGEWTLQPGRSSSEERRVHTGEEGTLILEGRVLFEAGDERFELAEGDYVAFDARTPHRVTALGAHAARGLFIICPPSF
jgi:transcriptional regulator with XRE-family HTH domain